MTLDCQGCGGCCRHMGYPPFAGMYDGGDSEWLVLRETHPNLAQEALDGAIQERGDQELPCLWLDPVTKACRNYEHRPSICREFELGSESCLDFRKLYNIGA